LNLRLLICQLIASLTISSRSDLRALPLEHSARHFVAATLFKFSVDIANTPIKMALPVSGPDASYKDPEKMSANVAPMPLHPERTKDMEETQIFHHDNTHRMLKSRHIQLIGIGGTIGTALFVRPVAL
jgi:hypothetical protein